MNRLLGWHTKAGDLGLRLLQLHLLWIWWTLRGAVVLGVFPATAAVLAVVRRDAMRGDDGSDRAPLRQEFGAFWRQELGAANVVGYAVTVVWVVLLLDRHVLAVVDLGPAGPVLAGVLWVVTAFAFVMTVSLPALSAHFADRPGALLRRAAVLVVARPRQALLNALVVGIVLCTYYVVPGLIPVFGVAMPAYLSFSYLWGSGLLGAPAAGTVAAEPVAAGTAR